MKSLKKEFIKTSLIGFVVSFLVMGILYEFIQTVVIKEKVAQAKNIATTILYYRNYLAKISPYIKVVNPHISYFSLTPAYVTNEVAKNLREDKFYIKQVSDRYRNIIDKPKHFELKAIEYFKTHKNKKEYYKVYPANKYFNKKHVFYARKLIIEKSCLSCHGVPYKDVPANLYHKIKNIYGDRAFNYKLGDVRGIISIVFPYQKVFNDVIKIFGVVIGIGVVFFIIGLFVFFRLHKNIINNIEKILNHFAFTKKGRYPILKEKMNFLEFNELKTQINKTFFTLKKYEGLAYKKHFFNSLTHLPNRNKLSEFLEKNKYIIVLINIDKFKDINFYFGTEIGNELIVEVAKRLKEIKKTYKYKLFHIDIDEFALLFALQDNEELAKIIRSILAQLEQPYNIRGHEILVRFRAGVSAEKKEFLRADIALDMAKELKKDIVFGKEINDLDRYKEHLNWLKKIKWALENDRIVPFFQPIVDKNEQIIKYESLVRLIDEEEEIISPFFFLEIAKKSRLYLDITKRMINKVIEKLEKENIAVSVNLTLEDMDDEEMRGFILEKLNTLKDKSLLTFEIVENEDVGENEVVKDFLKEVKSLGAQIYIDDFGSGYSNFDYLIKLKPDGVKIDGSLIKNILTDKNSEIIVKTIILFAKEMNIKTIAEFVENREIFEKLKNLGIDYFQGYYFSAPKRDI